jgi:seryl-tRNA synthetase
MSELQSSDVQQAVQGAMQGIKNDVARISSLADSINKVASSVHDISSRLANLERNVNQIQNTVASTLGSGPNQPHPDPRISGIASDVANLKVRFTAIEQFANQMTHYLQDRHQRDKEDNEYRTA